MKILLFFLVKLLFRKFFLNCRIESDDFQKKVTIVRIDKKISASGIYRYRMSIIVKLS
jgi:hypothetical protein